MYDSHCDVSCILSSFKGHNFTLYYVRAAISVLHDLPKIASIYSLNGRALLSQKRLDPAKCKKYDHSIKLKSHKNLFRDCPLTPCLVQIAQCYFDFIRLINFHGETILTSQKSLF